MKKLIVVLMVFGLISPVFGEDYGTTVSGKGTCSVQSFAKAEGEEVAKGDIDSNKDASKASGVATEKVDKKKKEAE